ncbi:MAG TPA: sigma-70 family RNA polymerase sigma factor [Solirubrobacteraceae bacterium]|nr:sigma-70 family RNA polymerase sigma factor [Solirubrobacteraceae bacterium]
MGTVTSAAPAVPAPASEGSLLLRRLSDELLARQASRGSERAFTVLYERYHQPIYRYCRSIVRHDDDAQDVLQSTFTAALSALRREQRNAPLRPWLYRIAHNEAITLLRRRSRDSARELSDLGPQAVASAEDQAADRARWATLFADLAGLPDRQRSALVMRELSGLSHEEIGIVLGTGVGGAKQAIFEARQALAQLAEGRAMSCDEVRERLSAGDRRVLRGRRVRAHLRNCHGCTAFAAAIPERRAELRALTPVLPVSAAALVLSRSLHAASAHGGSGAALGSGAAAAGTAGAVTKAAGTAVIWKAATGVAVLATAAAGVTGLDRVLGHGHVASPRVSRTAGRHGASTGANHALRSGSTLTPGVITAGSARAGTAGGHSRAAHSSSNSSPGAAVLPAASTLTTARHGKSAASHGSSGGAVVRQGGSEGRSAAHSRSSPHAHAPAAHRLAAGQGHPKSGSNGGGTHTGTNAHTKTQPAQTGSATQSNSATHGNPGIPVTITTPGKAQTPHTP